MVRTERIQSFHYIPYYLKVHIDSQSLGISSNDIKVQLDSGNHRIWVEDIDHDTIGISINKLNQEEDEIVANRLNDILIRKKI